MLSFGVHNDSHQDTTPGAGCLLSPPEGFAGSEREYFALLREEYCHPSFKQRLWLLANRGKRRGRAEPVEITGPYAEAARKALTRIETINEGKSA